jgi:hypothetical protein
MPVPHQHYVPRNRPIFTTEDRVPDPDWADPDSWDLVDAQRVARMQHDEDAELFGLLPSRDRVRSLRFD